MEETYLSLSGAAVDAARLEIPKARAMARYLQRGEHPFARLVEALRFDQGGQEAVVMDVDVQRPQRAVNPIRHVERIAVRFTPEDGNWPEVLALRPDFPRVPHLNLTIEELPRSLCLYDAPYDELRHTWTAASFVERIRIWLSNTARGTLHAPDQPLEPLLSPSVAHVILPHALLERACEIKEGDINLDSFLPIARIAVGDGREVFTAEDLSPRRDTATRDRQGVEMLAIIVRGEPQTHGIIARQPTSLSELHDFLIPAQINLIGYLRQMLLPKRFEPSFLKAHVVIIVLLPARRTDEAQAEGLHAWAFYVLTPVSQLGEQIGIWTLGSGLAMASKTGEPIMDVPLPLTVINDRLRGQNTSLALWNPTFTLVRSTAAIANGLQTAATFHIVAIGMGALGSQVFANLVRTGYGEWTIVDSDYMLPHNAARHAIFGDAAGFAKAEAMAQLANHLLDGPPVAHAIVADVLHPHARASELQAAYTRAEVILDMSASGAVARHIACEVASGARRASLFVTPSGCDATMLVEDEGRKIAIDVLEMQYYRHLLQSAEWSQHLRSSDGHQRYGRSCRDVSSIIPQDMVALHAANGARMFRDALEKAEATIHLWHADSNGAVRVANVKPAPAIRTLAGGWTIVSDEQVLDDVVSRRHARLPLETGGILLGACDTQRKIVYVVDSLPSPSDSIEARDAYVRGQAEMLDLLKRAQEVTAGMIDYIGEWHSHPPGHTSTPSLTDLQAFTQLREVRQADGFPTLMLIVGETQNVTWLLDDPEEDRRRGTHVQVSSTNQCIERKT